MCIYDTLKRTLWTTPFSSAHSLHQSKAHNLHKHPHTHSRVLRIWGDDEQRRNRSQRANDINYYCKSKTQHTSWHTHTHPHTCTHSRVPEKMQYCAFRELFKVIINYIINTFMYYISIMTTWRYAHSTYDCILRYIAGVIVGMFARGVNLCIMYRE